MRLKSGLKNDDGGGDGGDDDDEDDDYDNADDEDVTTTMPMTQTYLFSINVSGSQTYDARTRRDLTPLYSETFH